MSDERFTDSWIRHRIEGAYGPFRIRSELNQKGVEKSLVDIKLSELTIHWSDIAQQAWQKKFKQLPEDWPEKAKQIRYLQYRGFYSNDIEIMFDELISNNDR